MELSKSHQQLKSFLESNAVVGLAEELFEHVPGLLFFVKDRQRRFVYVNQSLSDMFGLSRKADIIGKYDSEYCDDYVEKMFKQDDEAILTQGVHIRNKIELVTTMNGVLKWHITNKIPLYTQAGEICGIAGITREFEDDRIAGSGDIVRSTRWFALSTSTTAKNCRRLDSRALPDCQSVRSGGTSKKPFTLLQPNTLVVTAFNRPAAC